MNLSTSIILIIVFVMFGLAIWHIIKNKSSCSCGLKDCANCSSCCDKKIKKE